jgi:hypothetical protein
MNFCRGCGEDFASVAAFDRHRVGVHAYTFAQGLLVNPTVEDGRTCMDEEELYVVGMELDSRGRWCITADAERIREAFSGYVRRPRGLRRSSWWSKPFWLGAQRLRR